MATPGLIERYERLATKIVNAIEAGARYAEITSSMKAMRVIVRTIPSSEHNGLRITPQDLEELAANLRREDAIDNGAGKLRSVRVTHRDPGAGKSAFHRRLGQSGVC